MRPAWTPSPAALAPVRPIGQEPRGVTRRGFLAALPAAAALGSCRPLPYVASDFAFPARSAVALLPASYDDDLADVIERGLQELGTEVRGRRVLIKPNLVEYESGTVINTHPLVTCGAAAALLKLGAREVIVGEGPGHRRDFEYLLTATGLHDHIRELRLPFVDLNHDDVRLVALRSRFMGLDALAFPVELLRADLVVSVPKLKTHHWAGMTAGMKNLFGVVPGAVYGWPKNLLHFRGIDNAVLDLTATIRPGLAIVDAIVAMEGDGPIMGRPRQTSFLALGHDPVAVDATCARIIGLDPAKIPYLAAASTFLGNTAESRIDQRGEHPDRYRTRFDVVDSMKLLRLET